LGSTSPQPALPALADGLLSGIRPIAGQQCAVRELIALRLPKSLLLAGVAAAVSVPIALLIGILSAMYRDSRLDRHSTSLRCRWSRARVPRRDRGRADLCGAAALVSALSYAPDNPGMDSSARLCPAGETLCFVIVARWRA